jgi:DNA polymerase alpha subunit A
LRQQLHPPVARLCEPIAGTDAAQLAQCLGLDPSKFAHGSSGGTDGDRPRTLTSQLTDAQRFADVVPLKLLCHACSVRSPVTGLFHKGTVRVCPAPPFRPPAPFSYPH